MKAMHYPLWAQKAHSRRSTSAGDGDNRLRQQEAVARIGELALECRDIEGLLSEAVELTARALDVELVCFVTRKQDGKKGLLKTGSGWNDGLIGREEMETGEGSLVAHVMGVDGAVVIEDLRNEGRFKPPRLLRDHEVVSGLCTGIRWGETPWGMLGAYTRRRRVFRDGDRQFFVRIAKILSGAIQRSRIEDDLRSSRDEMEIILNGVSEAITVQDCDQKYVFANQSAAAMLGLASVEDLLATQPDPLSSGYEMFDEEGNPFPPEKLPVRLALKGVADISARIHIKQEAAGIDRWVIVDSNPVRDMAGNVIQAVSIFRDITELERTQKSQRLLAEAGELLASSLDYETTLRNLAQLAVTDLADWCSVHLLGEGGVNQLVVAHRDPAMVESALELQRRYPVDWNGSGSLARVLRSGQAEFYREVPDWFLAGEAISPEHLDILREMGLSALMILPLKGIDQAWGALTLIWTGPGRRFSPADQELAQELVRRASIAIENARLYKEAQDLNAKLELRVEQRTEELEESIRMLWNEIEERKRVEDALRESEAMLNSLFESAPDATVLVDASGNIAQVNRLAEVVFGYRREELLGKPIEVLIPRKYQQSHSSHRAKYFERLEARPMGAGLELYAVRKDGSEFPVDVMLSPVQLKKADMVISAVRDITAQKRLQKELEETHRRLFESTEAERLALSQEIHDGPMQELYGLSYGIEALKPVLEGREGLAELESAQSTIQGVIETLRAICGELRPPALTHFGLEKAIRSHLTRVSEKNPDLKIMLNIDGVHGPLPERTQVALFRVYQNSISNILRHARATQVLIDLRMRADGVALKIRDDGQGFSMPARLVELARAGHFGLVGMKERAEALGGSLRVVSAPGQGTTIEVEVPMAAGS